MIDVDIYEFPADDSTHDEPVCRTFRYPVPEGGMMMLAVVNSLKTGRTVWTCLNASVVALSSSTSATYLRAEFSNRPTDLRGESLLENHEIWVEHENRPECERMLAENCPCSVQWFDVIEVTFASEQEHRAFAAAYTAITGMRNAFSGATAQTLKPGLSQFFIS